MVVARFLAVASLCGVLCACAGAPQGGSTIALPTAPPPGEPNGLAGMDAANLRMAFGPPAFVRKDGTVELWRYDTAACKAFFFLYPDGNTFAVRHVETVPRGRDIAADTDCLDQLRARANAPLS
ncbi:MAG: hypothetical protein ACLQUZ_02980 [Rhizomicrobium sp.]